MGESDMNAIIDRLEEYFPNVRCELDYKTPFELLVAVILSAQCTDKRVNKVTAELFKKYNTPKDFAQIDPGELEKYIFTAGFYKNKSRHIIAAAQIIMTEYGGDVPSERDELVKLPGVGRKTANVILSEAFKKNAFAVDTHVLRVANRLGVTKSRDPYKVESDVSNRLKEERLGKAHILLVAFGRYICTARNPKCRECPISCFCPAFDMALDKRPRLKNP
ncbi:MAG: endonuclease III [Clostridiales bacterium]|jgi:endonuclease-3|nr:endonuclease III [Clostridiales bacterium]